MWDRVWCSESMLVPGEETGKLRGWAGDLDSLQRRPPITIRLLGTAGRDSENGSDTERESRREATERGRESERERVTPADSHE